MTAVEISVVVPVHNAAETVGEQMRALAAQETDRVWEVVVVDNASTDATASAVAEHLAAVPDGRLVTETTPGVSAARNAGVAAAHGRSILFCDGDDQVAPGWLEAMAAALVDHSLVGGRLDRREINPHGQLAPGSELSRELRRYGGVVSVPAGACLGVRRSLFEQIGGFDSHVDGAEDVDFALQARRRGVTAQFVPDAVVHYRDRVDLRTNFRQYWNYGRVEPLLYRRYRADGLRRDVRTEVGFWVATGKTAVRAPWSPPHRVRLARRLGRGCGRLLGGFTRSAPSR